MYHVSQVKLDKIIASFVDSAINKPVKIQSSSSAVTFSILV
jgi:hypothetical protein